MEFQYTSRGKGTPVVLLPGLFAGDWIWDKLLSNFSLEEYRLIKLSHPFATFENISSLGDLRDFLSRVLDFMDVDSAIIIGNSLGGLVALDFAYFFPKQVKALIISGVPGLGDRVNLRLNVTRKINEAWLIELGDKLFYDTSQIENKKELLDKIKPIFQHRPYFSNLLRLLKISRKYDFISCLPSIQCPVLLIWGANDQVTPVDDWKKQLYLIKNAELDIIDHCGHSPMIESSKEFSIAVIKFIKNLP